MAVVVIIEMMPSLLRIPIDQDGVEKSPWELLRHVLDTAWAETHFLTFWISGVSITFCLLIRHLKKIHTAIYFIPEILITISTTTLLSYLFSWSEHGVAILKDVAGGLISPRIPQHISIDRIDSLFLSAALIALIGFVESIAVAKTYGAEYGYSVSPNRELVALGFGNFIASFFGAWPVFVSVFLINDQGSLSRSAVSNSAGAKTQMAGAINGFAILLASAYLLPVFYYLPKCVCSAVIVVSAFQLLEFHDLWFILRIKAWKDLAMLFGTFFMFIWLIY